MKKVLLAVLLSGFGSLSDAQVSKKKLPCYDIKQMMKVEVTPLYQPHLDAARSFGVKLLEDAPMVQKYIAGGKLKKIQKTGKGYKIQKLDYSRPYMVSKAKSLLEKMGTRFSKETGGHTFTVSSLTRTLEDQCRLRRVNANAAVGISSHNYGNSFDISYIRFNDVLKYNPKMEIALEKVLQYYLKKGMILYIKERQQSCYHITVRNY